MSAPLICGCQNSSTGVPNYFYTAKSFDGVEEEGNLVADDQRQLAQALKSRGMVLVGAKEKKPKRGLNMDISLPFMKIPQTEIMMITRNLGVMFSTGLSLMKSFEILANQARNKKVKTALLDIKETINKGENFSDALARHPEIFSELFCNMIKAGEESGTMDEIFQALSLQLQKEHELRSKIKNAMIYPCIILLVMLVVAIVIVMFVLPSLNIFFTSLSVDIPFYTKALLWLGNFMVEKWYLVLLGAAGGAGAGWMALRTKRGKLALDNFLLKAPVISPIIKKNNSAFLVRSLSSLVAAGVSLVRALEITANTMGSHAFKEAALDAAQKIKKGEKLSAALKNYQNIFPFGVTEMVEVGEETGKTSVILKKLADFYEQEAITAVEKLTTIIEPILIIGLGLAVGVFALSIIQPMYSSLQSIQ